MSGTTIGLRVALNILVAILIAVALCALCGAAIAWINADSKKKVQRRFALCECAACGSAFGLDVILRGKDTSPFEELWQIGEEFDVHCHPTCHTVTCDSCGRSMETRYQTQGEDFGPELLVSPSGDDEDTAGR